MSKFPMWPLPSRSTSSILLSALCGGQWVSQGPSKLEESCPPEGPV